MRMSSVGGEGTRGKSSKVIKVNIFGIGPMNGLFVVVNHLVVDIIPTYTMFRGKA